MRRSVLKIVIIVAILFVASGIVYAEYLGTKKAANEDPDCTQCHACEKPTSRDICLKPCYRHVVRSQSSGHSLSEAPDTVLLDELVAEYLPIQFDHKLHARMAGMNDNCSSCHHYSPKGEIPACRTCHPKDAASASDAQPDLRTAYHRQCLGCHSQWANQALCDVCHPEPNGGTHKPKLTGDSTYTCVVSVPVSKTYKTTFKSAPFVTFQHVEHIEEFGLECVDCHQNENCQYCHDQINRENLSKPMNQIHAICSGCHEIGSELAGTDGCDECHDPVEQPARFHSIVGYKLPQYVKHLGCTGCHECKGSMGQ